MGIREVGNTFSYGFQRDEQEREKKISDFNNGINAIKKQEDNGQISEEEAERAKYNWSSKYMDVPEAAQYLGFAAAGEKSALDIIREREAERAKTVEKKFTITPEEWQQAAEDKNAWVRDKETKEAVELPIAAAKKAVEDGKATWMSSPITPEKEQWEWLRKPVGGESFLEMGKVWDERLGEYRKKGNVLTREKESFWF